MAKRGTRINPRPDELAQLRARVAELEAAEVRRKETEEQFRAFVETTNEWVWRIDREANHTYSNPALWLILGYSPREFTSHKTLDYLHEEDRCKVGEMLKEKIARKEGWTALVLRWRHKDGGFRYLESTAVPILDEHGNLKGFQGADRDISERRRAEEALRESEARFRSLVETTSDWIWEVDARLAYTYCSPKVFDLLGYEPGEIIGKRPFDLMPPDEALRVAPQIAKLVAAARPFVGIENVNLHKDGRHVSLETSGVPILDDRGLLKGYRGIDRDITGRKETERALQEEFAFRNGIIECAAEGLCVCHEVSDFPYVGFTVWNNRMTEITGYTIEEINRLGWYQSLYPDQEVQRRARERMARMRTGDNLKGEEWEITRSDGTRRLVGISTSSIVRRTSGEVHVLALIQDLTERKRAEEERHKLEAQMQHAQKLESLGILAGGIAHDFNNLLTAILGHANLALLELPSESGVRPSIEAIEESSHRAADLCRQLLAYAGMGRFVVEPVDLSLVVRELTHLLQVSVSKKALLRCNLGSELPAIEADPAQVRQVIMNLVINASEAIGDEEGVVAITTGVMQCDEAYLRESRTSEIPAPGTYVFVEVIDTGCGMDADTLTKVFDPFFTSKFTGRGLGLAAVQGIVRSHKGAIKLESAIGKGTCFRVLFPASRAEAAPPAEKAPVLHQGTGLVLLVDDEEQVRKVTRIILERCGFRVLTAANGREAINIFRERSAEIACVLLDLTMPKMDGVETYRELRGIREDVRVILASGYSGQELSRRFHDLGLAGFLAKPFEASALSAMLNDVLNRAGTRPGS